MLPPPLLLLPPPPLNHPGLPRHSTSNANSPLCVTNVLTTVADKGREALVVWPAASRGMTVNSSARNALMSFNKSVPPDSSATPDSHATRCGAHPPHSSGGPSSLQSQS